MANVFATKTGNWSDTTVWNTGALPTAADDVYSNNFTVTVNVSPTVLSIRNTASTGINAGGGFTATNGITLTATGAGIISGTVTCFTSNLTGVQSCTITGNIQAGTTNSAVGNTSTGILNVFGEVRGGSGAASGNHGINNLAAGAVNITGNVFGGGSGTAVACVGANNTGLGTLTIVGSVTGGIAAGSQGVFNNGNGSIYVTGNITGGSLNGAQGLVNNALGNVFITGSVTGGASGVGAINLSTGAMSIIGDINGGAGVAGAVNNSTGTMVHVGAAHASAAAAAIGSGAAGQITTLTGPLISTAGAGVLAANSGVNPCTAARWFPADTALGTFTYTMRGATAAGSPSERPARVFALPEGYNAGYPATGNVRSGTTFGPGSIYTGTCAVPAAGSVAFGVPIDNTTGTATLTAANIRSAIGLASANLDTQLDALPTATENATAVRSELATELGRIDASVSSRSTFNPATDTVANVTLVDTTTNLTNPPDVPTTAEIATAVADTLDLTLAQIDNNVLSRLAEVDYTTPPTAGQNAEAVRVELTPELNRVANCATVATTGQQIQDALST